MPLASTAEIIERAYAAGHGVGAFNVAHLEHAHAVVAGAEEAAAPVVLQISENAARHHGALEPIARAALAIARASAVPVAVHLDHATGRELVQEAVSLGCSSVMFDGSRLPYDQNVRATAEVVAFCRERGVLVEAELGEVGGKDGVHAPGARTDPDEGRAFVRATGVDALAVAVGTSHAMLTRDARVDLDLIARLRRALPVPLVLHGSSGVPDGDLAGAVRAGMTKVNIATRLNQRFTGAVREFLAEHPDVADTRAYLARGREAARLEVTRMLEVLAARGRSGAG